MEGELDQHWRYCHSIDGPCLSCDRRRSPHSARDCMRHCRRGRDVVQEGPRTAFQAWYDLLLVLAGSVHISNLPLDHALVGELPPVHLRCCLFRVRMVRSIGSSITLATLGAATHWWNELVLCRHVDCVLRGQWKTIARLEKPSPLHLLAPARDSRIAANRLGVVLAPISSGISAWPPRKGEGSRRQWA